jgi:hypothetical protein
MEPKFKVGDEVTITELCMFYGANGTVSEVYQSNSGVFYIVDRGAVPFGVEEESLALTSDFESGEA